MKADEQKDLRQKITVTKDGPYLVSGSVPLNKEIIVSDSEGTPEKWEHGKKLPLQANYSLCRCGESKNKPFCDSAHVKAGFDGTETACDLPHSEQAEHTIGQGLVLSDNPSLCSLTRFCHRSGDAWELTEQSQDPESKQAAIQDAFDCPSGRIVAIDPATGEPMEPELEISIGLIEDPCHKVSGPLWVKGGIPIEASDGIEYEVRNRVTLCRCGRSNNKPYCDGTHKSTGFKDGDPSVE